MIHLDFLWLSLRLLEYVISNQAVAITNFKNMISDFEFLVGFNARSDLSYSLTTIFLDVIDNIDCKCKVLLIDYIDFDI
jgi:hypothetical protein